MNKRIILKTVCICTGIFIMLSAVITYFLINSFQPDTEKRHQVIVAGTDIDVGTVITESMLATKIIKESSVNAYMLNEAEAALGKKAAAFVKEGDYIRSYALLDKDKWFNEKDRIIILPMEVEDRLANLIRKGSFIDIKVFSTTLAARPKVVLSKVRVEDILDETGTSIEYAAAVKKAYAKIVLNDMQRDRIYAAMQSGKLGYELYCDNTQKPAEEEFIIPDTYR